MKMSLLRQLSTSKRKCVPLFFALLILFITACERRQMAALNVPIPSNPVNVTEIHDFVFYNMEGGIFELPVAGASGYAAVNLPLFTNASANANITRSLPPGQGFTILEHQGHWWYVSVNNTRGWIRNELAMINIPDVIPSIVQNNTNTYSSLFRSSGFDIPNITGQALFQMRDFNARLGRYEFIAPVLFGTAKKIMKAQQAALADGNTLVLYEAFRPAEAHNFLHEHFSYLAYTNPIVYAGITERPFNIRWFLAESPYTHQRGTGIDVSLARIENYVIRTTGDYAFIHITGYTEFEMQSPMHELSVASVVFRDAVHSRSPDTWRDTEFADAATYGTRLMHRYLTDAGLTPLASEWWHFNDLEFTDFNCTENVGEYFIESSFSVPPLRARR